jgi:glycosyltransferase involved in cell wall biosynthesis
MGELTPRLVVIGQRGWECENVLDLLERSEPVRQSVIELGRCSDQELATWLGHARALLFPSFAEGYGLPLMEALAAGVPVIASDLPVFREIAGAVPEYLDPLDGLGWRNMVQEYASPGSTRRSAQCLRLAGFRSPTWAQHFERVGMLVEELA